MTNKLIVLEDSNCQHFGSVYGGGSVTSTINNATPNFVTIENKKVMTENNIIDTPSHQYDVDGLGNPLFHSHPNQVVDTISNDFVTIENKKILRVDDKSSSEDTRTTTGGTNTFSKIEV